MEVVIRAFRPNDLEGLFVLDYRCYKPPYRFGYSQLAHTLSDAAITVVVIDDEEARELIGGLILRSNSKSREAAVVSLMVEREHRRQGLGKRLLARAQEFVRVSRWTRLLVPLERGNEAGAALLRSGGCEDSGQVQPFYHSEEEGSLWVWRPGAAEALEEKGAEREEAESAPGESDDVSPDTASGTDTGAGAETATGTTPDPAQAGKGAI